MKKKKKQNVLEGAPADHLLRLLVGEMRIRFERLRQHVAAQSNREGLQPETASETELESPVRQARRKQAKPASGKQKKRSR